MLPAEREKSTELAGEQGSVGVVFAATQSFERSFEPFDSLPWVAVGEVDLSQAGGDAGRSSGPAQCRVSGFSPFEKFPRLYRLCPEPGHLPCAVSERRLLEWFVRQRSCSLEVALRLGGGAKRARSFAGTNQRQAGAIAYLRGVVCLGGELVCLDEV